MQHYVDRKFPDYVLTIEAAANSDGSFAALLGDYEELCTWLALKEKMALGENGEIQQALDLKEDLENEILQKLEERDDNAR